MQIPFNSKTAFGLCRNAIGKIYFRGVGMSSDLESNEQQINIKEVKSNTPLVYEFEEFCLDAEHLMLSRDRDEISLTPKVVETLLALIERHGQIVSKDELMERVWGNAIVEESNLVQNIYILRKALGKTRDGRPMIETLRRRGYRFNGEVTAAAKEKKMVAVDASVADDHVIPNETTKPRRRIFVYSIAALAVLASIFLGVFAIMRFSGPHDSVSAAEQIANISIKRLTPDVYTRSPVVSPDGRSLAYSQIDHDKESLWLKNMETGPEEQILPPVDLDQAYNVSHFSPDGSQIFYSTQLSGTLNRTIFRYTIRSKEITRIADDDISPTAISPDGKELVFIDSKYDLDMVNSDGSGGIRELRGPVPDQWLVAWNSQMSWSPDGTRIALCGSHLENGQARGDLIEFAVGSHEERRIPVPNDWMQVDDVVWLANGDDLLVTVRQSPAAPFQIYRLSSKTGLASRVTNDDHSYSWISISSDEKVLVAEQGSGHFNIWSASFPEMNDLRQLTFGNAAQDGFDGVALTPDGRILYTATRSGSVDLWMMNPDGSGQTQLTSNQGNWNGRPRVTPDGRFVVFSSTRSGINELWRMAPDGGNARQLTDSPDPAFRSTISADGKWAFYNTENTGAIWKVSIDGGDPVSVSQQKCLFPAISPDGQFIACTEIEKGQSNLWRVEIISAASGELLKKMDFPAGRSLFVWMPDSRSLISMNGNWGNFYRHSIDSDAELKLTDFTSDRFPYFAISSDFRRIIFSRGSSYSEAVQITGFSEIK